MVQAALFKPIQIRNLHLENRIVIAPMCQYSARDGCMTDWHLIHLGNLAISGAGLLTIEATAVVPEGRITWADVGLYDDKTEAAMGKVVESIRRWSNVPILVQLSHAGRKGSSEVPWAGGGQIAPDQPHGWKTVGPSPIAYLPSHVIPTTLNHDGLWEIRAAFVSAAVRAARLNIDGIQLHAAHGYLLHQFLSPLSNQRSDAYGGSIDNRMQFPLEVFDAVRAALPSDRAVSVRVSAVDWVEGGLGLAETIIFAKALEERGCDAIHVSSGGLHPEQHIKVGPGYQVPLARSIKAAVSMPVVAVGLITSAEQAEAIVSTGDADMIALGRTVLYDPRWPWHAAAELQAKVRAPKQYLRSEPRRLQGLFGVRGLVSPEPNWVEGDACHISLDEE